MAADWIPNCAILPGPQQRLWPELAAIPDGFVLFGGTAIALHLGHRESIDFDFFTSQPFDPEELRTSISILATGVTIQQQANTLTVTVDRGGPIQLSFFAVPNLRRLRFPLRAFDNHLQVADLLDLAATNAAIVQRRAEAKDYVDLDAIFTRTEISLPIALSAGMHVYGSNWNPSLTLRSLCYFGDGDLQKVSPEVRARLKCAVASVDLAHLPLVVHADGEGPR